MQPGIGHRPRSLATSYIYNGFGDVTKLVSPDTEDEHEKFDSGDMLSVATDARGANAHYSYGRS